MFGVTTFCNYYRSEDAVELAQIVE